MSEEKPLNCPGCGIAIGGEVKARVMAEARMSFALSPLPGQLISLRVVGESLINMQKMLAACGREHGVATKAMLESLETEPNGTLRFHLLIARAERGFKALKP